MSEGTNIAALAQQMATLTSRRDAHELALSMLALYNNFLNTRSATLYSIKHDGKIWLMKELASLHQDTPSLSDWRIIPEQLEHFSNHTDHRPIFKEGGLWLPIYRRKQLLNIIHLDANEPEPHEWLLIEGLLKIQENFTALS